MVEDAAAFAPTPWGWAAGVVVTQAFPTGCGTGLFPWQSALLKHPGVVPAGAGVAGWFAGLFGDPGKWHCAQTGAFEVFVSTCVYVGPRQGAAECGAPTPWHVKHGDSDPPPVKPAPWQIWQEASPGSPGARFAAAP